MQKCYTRLKRLATDKHSGLIVKCISDEENKISNFVSRWGYTLCKQFGKLTFYKQITIVNDDCRVIRMSLQFVASPMIIILRTVEVSFTILKIICSTDVTHVDHHMMIVIYL